MTAEPNIPPSDRVAVLTALDPISQSAAARSTGWVSMANWRTAMAVIQAGALGTSATLDAKIEQATSSGGAGAKDITGKAITQLTKAGSDDNKQAIINLRQDDLDMNGGFTHVRLTLTVGTAASLTSGLLLGFDAANGWASANDATTVDEIVS